MKYSSIFIRIVIIRKSWLSCYILESSIESCLLHSLRFFVGVIITLYSYAKDV